MTPREQLRMMEAMMADVEMKCFCTPRQKCPKHHEEYEPEIHGPNGSMVWRAEGLREITEARNRENKPAEMWEIYDQLKGSW